jgi:hypothetical protein
VLTRVRKNTLMHSDPWLVTFKLMDGAGTRHCYVIKDNVDGHTARTRARNKADTEAEKAARGGVQIDPEYIDVLELTPKVRARALRIDET